MRTLTKIKNRIGKSLPAVEKGVRIEEHNQRIFFEHEEYGIEKIPKIIDEIYLSNIAHRSFSHVFHHTIDEKKASLWREKITRKYFIRSINAGEEHIFVLDRTLVSRSKRIGVIFFSGTLSAMDIGIYPVWKAYPEDPAQYDPLYFYTVPANTYTAFQFPYSFTTCAIIVRAHRSNISIYIDVEFMPM